MLELKNSILELQLKIKYYKKYEPENNYIKEHKLNIKRFEDNLIKTTKKLKKLE